MYFSVHFWGVSEALTTTIQYKLDSYSIPFLKCLVLLEEYEFFLLNDMNIYKKTATPPRSSKNILPTYDFWTQNSVAFCCPNIGVVVGHWAAMAETIWAYILGSCILFDNSKRRQMNSTQNLVVYKVAKTY